MQYISHYSSPIGEILLAADDIGLTGLWFEGQKYFALSLDEEHEEREIPLFEKVKHWLDVYFSGKEPDFSIPLHAAGTVFQKEVWEILLDPLWTDYDLRSDRQSAGCQKRIAPHVRPGCRRRGRPQQDLYHRALPPRRWGGRKPYRVCRRH